MPAEQHSIKTPSHRAGVDGDEGDVESSKVEDAGGGQGLPVATRQRRPQHAGFVRQRQSGNTLALAAPSRTRCGCMGHVGLHVQS